MQKLILMAFLVVCGLKIEAQQTSSLKTDSTQKGISNPSTLKDTLLVNGADNSFDLNKCLKYAYKHSRNMANSSLDIEMAKAKVRETTGIGLPQITASGQFLFIPQIPTTFLFDFISPVVYSALNTNSVLNSSTNKIITVPGSFGAPVSAKFGLTHTSYASADLSQILFDGTYLVGLQAAHTFRELSTKTLIQTKIQTTVLVSKAYYNVLVAKEQINVLDAGIARIQKNYNDTKALQKNGLVEKIDLSRIELQLNTQVFQKINAIRVFNYGIDALKYQMGMNLEEPIKIPGEVKNMNLPEIIDTISLDPKQRIEYSLQSTQVHLYQLDVKRNRFTNLPTLTGIAEYRLAFQNNSFSNLFKTQYPQSFIGVNLNVPIFSGFQRSARTQQAKLTLQKSENDLLDLSRSLELEIKTSRGNYQNSLDDLQTQEKNKLLAKEIYRVAKIKYEQGIGSSLEESTAEADLKTAETGYLSALFNALVSKVDLDKATGVLVP